MERERQASNIGDPLEMLALIIAEDQREKARLTECWVTAFRDSRIALRRKLNGDTR